MKIGLLRLIHRIADRRMTRLTIKLGRWTEINRWACSKF